MLPLAMKHWPTPKRSFEQKRATSASCCHVVLIEGARERRNYLINTDLIPSGGGALASNTDGCGGRAGVQVSTEELDHCRGRSPLVAARPEDFHRLAPRIKVRRWFERISTYVLSFCPKRAESLSYDAGV